MRLIIIYLVMLIPCVVGGFLAAGGLGGLVGVVIFLLLVQ